MNRGGYTFTFIRQDGNRTLTRKESQDSSGSLKGIYWIQDPNGIFRLISYEADPDQRFQAQVLTNRPGEVNVTFPSPFSGMEQPPLVRTTTAAAASAVITTMTPMSPRPSSSNRSDEASLPSSSTRTDSSFDQVSSNCSGTVEAEDLVMIAAGSENMTTTTEMTPVSSSSDPQFETLFPATDVIPVTTVTAPDTTSDAMTTSGRREEEEEESVTEKKKSIDEHRSNASNGLVRKDSRERAKLISETTTTPSTRKTTTTRDDISDSEHETTSLPASTTESEDEQGVTSTATSSYSTLLDKDIDVTESVTSTTTATAEESGGPPAPVPEDGSPEGGEESDAEGSGLSALRYFMEYRIHLMNGGSIYRKEGTDSQGKVIGSYMFLVHDKDDINHKREQLTKKNNMTQELIKIIGG